ncbi:UNVERIFIED_CONTAM: hypothetical protein Slati_0695800 [Sesamum latifolium]|uniref:Uncharacterized protein n=1 Tax=Sesamum latifolium TaxID=2727402 RepID=A0AAW2Y529_9LAMI
MERLNGRPMVENENAIERTHDINTVRITVTGLVEPDITGCLLDISYLLMMHLLTWRSSSGDNLQAGRCK